MSVIKSLSVGNGDMFYINHNSDSFTIIDCCMDEDSRESIVDELKNASADKQVSRFISTHPDEDHIQGIKYLDETMPIVNFYCVKNQAVKEDETEDFQHYCKLRDGSKCYFVEKGCRRKWLNQGGTEHGCSGINFIWPITSNEDFKAAQEEAADGTAFNNLSPIFTYSVTNGIKVMWMGDMEHDFMEKIKDQVEWPKVDVLFAPHHGRASGKVPEEVLQKLDPFIVVIGEAPSKFLNYYSGYNTITQNSAGNIVFQCDGDYVDVFVSNPDYTLTTPFLDNNDVDDGEYGTYIGSFEPKGA